MSYIEEKMNRGDNQFQSRADLIPTTTSNRQLSSAADEDLTKLARLKEQGILSEAEFNQMKQEF